MKKFDSFKTLTRTMQSFLAIVLVTLMAVGNVVGQTTYSHTITAKTWSALEGGLLQLARRKENSHGIRFCLCVDIQPKGVKVLECSVQQEGQRGVCVCGRPD